jgi:predicted nuclease of predicted toxin-antitoxin system
MCGRDSRQAVADGLRRRSVDVLVVQDTGRRGAPDDEQLAFASQQGRVMVTMDSDFLILAAQGASHAGIAYAKPGMRSVGQLIQKLKLIHDVLTPAEMEIFTPTPEEFDLAHSIAKSTRSPSVKISPDAGGKRPSNDKGLTENCEEHRRIV